MGVLLAGILGCANIPLGTMLKLAIFGENYFLELDPSHIRTRVQLDNGFTMSIPDSSLNLQIETIQGLEFFAFPLRHVETVTLPGTSNWFSSTPARTQYDLALTDGAIASFSNLQSAISERNGQNYSLDVNVSLSGEPEGADQVTMSVLLKLTEEDDYFTLIDKATLDFGNREEQ